MQVSSLNKLKQKTCYDTFQENVPFHSRFLQEQVFLSFDFPDFQIQRAFISEISQLKKKPEAIIKEKAN